MADMYSSIDFDAAIDRMIGGSSDDSDSDSE